MLNLEQAIEQWRQEMLARGIDQRDVLDELESHLRDEIDQRIRAGADIGLAFAHAVKTIGEPTALKQEFRKTVGAREIGQSLKQFLFTLAGIPNTNLAMTTNNTSHTIEPGWVTYLKGGVFVLPAISLWAMSLIFVFPKLQQICRDAGVAMPGIYSVNHFIADHHLLLVLSVGLVVFLLEWRAPAWPKFRRATVGVSVFLINTIVLIFISTMVLLAVMAAPGLARLK